MAITFTYRATLEGGDTFEVTADQRDIAAFELEPFGVAFDQAASRPYTFARYLTWHAAKRRALTKLTWAEFSDQCVEIDFVDEEADADPGHPAASAGSPSKSPTRRGGRSQRS